MKEFYKKWRQDLGLWETKRLYGRKYWFFYTLFGLQDSYTRKRIGGHISYISKANPCNPSNNLKIDTDKYLENIIKMYSNA